MGAVSNRIPSLDVLDDINYRCLRIGFPLLTLGIITGSIWAEYAWGSYWSWDPKETWSLITWFLYAALLHGRLTVGWRGGEGGVHARAGCGRVPGAPRLPRRHDRALVAGAGGARRDRRGDHPLHLQPGRGVRAGGGGGLPGRRGRGGVPLRHSPHR